MYSSDFSTFFIDILYTSQISKQFLWNLSFLIGLIENSWTLQKHCWSTWNFILLLTEDDCWRLKSCSTNFILSDSCLLNGIIIDNWISATFKEKIWEINSLYLCVILTKTILGLEPARLKLKCDVSELKDKLF